MGRKALFTEEEVFHAADALVAEGKEVSASALLAALGGGSLTTIYKHLAEWRAKRPASTTGGVPLEIPEPVQGAFAAAWRVASTEASKEIAIVKEKANDEVKTAQKQFKEAVDSISKLEAESELDAGKIEALNSQVEELQASLRSLENERAGLGATVHQQREQIKSVESELARVHQETEQERTRYSTEFERIHKELDEERRRHQEEIAKLEKTLSELNQSSTKERDSLRKSLAESELQAEKNALERSEALKNLDESKRERDKAMKERDEAMKDASQLAGQMDALKSQNSDLLSRLSPPPKK